MINITDAGLEKNSLDENLDYVQTLIKLQKGDDVDLSPTGPWGQIAAILAKFATDNGDQQEEIYLSRDPDNATGIAQDKLSAETGTYRRGATKTVVQHVLLKGDEGTPILAGKQIKLTPEFSKEDSLYFTLNSRVVISRNTARRVVLSLDDVTIGSVYEIVINSLIIKHTTVAGDSVSTVIASLITRLPEEVIGTNVNDTVVLFGDEKDFTISYSATLTLEELWGAGDFTASITGAYSVPSNSLTEIITPVSGWDAVTNPSSGVTGKGRESDTALIIRRKNELIKGKGTDAAITNAVFNIDNVSSASVTSNRTRGEVDGIPPNSFEVVVLGGIPNNIAQAIFDNMPAGIGPYGISYTGVAEDSLGQFHTIPFSRPSVTYLWVRFTRTTHPEEIYPTNGNSLVKNAVLTWVEGNIKQGTDVVRQRLESPFFEVPGSATVITEIAQTEDPNGTPEWETENIAIPARETAEFDADRIFIINA